MEGVLEGATVLSVCKVACSLPFLRSVSSYSPVSFCCCCLLVFTDVILTVFLSVLLLLDRWQIEAPSTGDAIALRSLLFISHTYGTVFLITLPAVVVDRFIRLLQPQDTYNHQTPNLRYATKSTNETGKKPFLGYHVVAYLCCLSLWTFGTLNIRWRWKQEEVWTAACLYSTNSLLTCLPNIYSPMMRFLNPCWVMTSLFITLAIILIICLLNIKPPVMQLRSPDVDTVSFQNSFKVQTFANREVDLSPGCATSDKMIVQEDDKRTEKVIRLTLTEERPQSGNVWVFPCPGADVMIGVMCMLAMFVLPLNLSVNVHVISSVEKILQRSIKCLGLAKSVVPYDDMDII